MGEGFTLQLASLSDFPVFYTLYDPMSSITDGVIRVDGYAVREEPLLARNTIIHIQDELSLPG